VNLYFDCIVVALESIAHVDPIEDSPKTLLFTIISLVLIKYLGLIAAQTQTRLTQNVICKLVMVILSNLNEHMHILSGSFPFISLIYILMRVPIN